MAARAMQSEADGEHVIDMDTVAELVLADQPRPEFYYAEESQQYVSNCKGCGTGTDIVGRYAYCFNCGAYNGLQELETDINALRKHIAQEVDYAMSVTRMVSSFDSFARQIAKQLAARVPMTRGRLREWETKLFHNIDRSSSALSAAFDISMMRAINDEDAAFVRLMFHRRHVYEHNGGEVDERYIAESGDTSVRIKQVISETQDSASRLSDIVLRMGRNTLNGFHELFPPVKQAIGKSQ